MESKNDNEMNTFTDLARKKDEDDVYSIKIYNDEFHEVKRERSVIEQYTNTQGLSVAIDLITWLSISEQVRQNLISIVENKLRPQGLDKNLWKMLKDDKYKDLKDTIIKQSQTQEDKTESLTDKNIDKPDHVIQSIWEHLDPATKQKIRGKIPYLRPHGINKELWSKFTERERLRIYSDHLQEEEKENLTWFQRQKKNSQVVAFFSGGSHCIIEEPDAGVSAMALVCALILTIPYNLFGYLNNGFFSAITDSLNACPNGASKYGYASGYTAQNTYTGIMQNFAMTLYMSMIGLIVMGIYFLFKPLPGKDMDKWQRSQGRALLMLMYLVTLLASVGVIGLSSLLLNFAGQNSELCNYDSRYVTGPGILGVSFSFILSIFSMW